MENLKMKAAKINNTKSFNLNYNKVEVFDFKNNLFNLNYKKILARIFATRDYLNNDSKSNTIDLDSVKIFNINKIDANVISFEFLLKINKKFHYGNVLKFFHSDASDINIEKLFNNFADSLLETKAKKVLQKNKKEQMKNIKDVLDLFKLNKNYPLINLRGTFLKGENFVNIRSYFWAVSNYIGSREYDIKIKESAVLETETV